jgi:hypothetical protein
MARKVADVTIADEGRDKGKVFVITEMSSAQAESWAMRVLLALVGSNVDVPEDFAELGMAGLAEYGMKALASLKWNTCEPLLAEMFGGIQIRPDRTKPHVIRDMWDADIEEVATRFKLRAEWWALHMDFLQGVVGSTSQSEKAPATPKHRRPIATSRS